VATFYILVHLSFGFRTRDFLKGLLPDLCVMGAVALSGYGCTFLPVLPLVGAFAVKLAIMGAVYLLALVLTRQLRPLVALLFRR
jgi:hypothetical protein